MDNNRLRVLIIAHELSPIHGSECAEGWNLVTRLAKYHDVTVLYASGSPFAKNCYFDAVNNYIHENGIVQGLTFVNLDSPKTVKIISYVNHIFKRIGPIGFPPLFFIEYRYWQKKAYNEAKKLHEINNYHVVHQLTAITFREPGYTWKLDIPFVWGPTGGMSILPKSFWSILPQTSKLLELIRTISTYYQINFVSRIKDANKKASLIYTFSKVDSTIFSKRAVGDVKLMLDAGTYSLKKESSKYIKDPEILNGIWCGQLNGRKAPSILLHALALEEITRKKVKFKIIGKGPMKESLQKLYHKLELTNVEFIEYVSHDEIFELMAQADFFVHTSLREATTNVIPEALSMGLPVICHDISGMDIAIDETCGIKIAFLSPQISISGFHDAIKKLILDRNILKDLQIGAKSRASKITWDIMAKNIANDYTEIAKKRFYA